MSINSKDSKLKEKKVSESESERKQYKKWMIKTTKALQKKRVLIVRVY